MLDPDREVFPDPFVRLVDAYVSFDTKLSDSDYDAILRSVLDADFSVVLPSSLDKESGDELFSAVRGPDSVIVKQDVLYISTAKYVRWERFRDLVAELLEPVTKERKVKHVSVLFLDEIRPASSTGLLDWSEYVNLPVVTHDIPLEHVAGAYGGLVLHLDHSKHINIEWTHTSESAFEDDHPLYQHYDDPEDSLLAVEWNGRCQFEEPASAEVALGEFDSLHTVIKEAFLQVLTPASMKLLRGQA